MKKKRILVIDIFRALTMFFMIFVNDLWTLTEVPKWLKHTAASEDGMGFSDIIFPIFLFIVGLSVPLAIGVRLKKKDPHFKIITHILYRSFALLVMGIFMVNSESIFDANMPFNQYVWKLLMAIGIYLIWLHYDTMPNLKKYKENILKGLGVLILLILAFVYEGGSAEEIVWLKPHWWGILGIIGWAYLFSSIFYLYLGKKLLYVIIAFVILLFLNIQENAFFKGLPSFTMVVSASNYSFVMAGILCTKLFKYFQEKEKQAVFLYLLSGLGISFLAYGFLWRPQFIISKILATPSWAAICIGICFLSYVFFFVLIEKWGINKWANHIKAAGTSTLTCYLIPYFVYPIVALIGFTMPDMLTTGIVGILKALVFSFLIIKFVSWLETKYLGLKL